MTLPLPIARPGVHEGGERVPYPSDPTLPLPQARSGLGEGTLTKRPLSPRLGLVYHDKDGRQWSVLSRMLMRGCLAMWQIGTHLLISIFFAFIWYPKKIRKFLAFFALHRQWSGQFQLWEEVSEGEFTIRVKSLLNMSENTGNAKYESVPMENLFVHKILKPSRIAMKKWKMREGLFTTNGTIFPFPSLLLKRASKRHRWLTTKYL